MSLEQEIRAELRLQAIENMVAIVSALAIVALEKVTGEDIAGALKDAVLTRAMSVTASGDLDAAMSTHAAGELEEAFMRLFARIDTNLTAMRVVRG